LIQGRREIVCQTLGRRQLIDPRSGRHNPPQSQGGSERLGYGADIGDAIWGESLNGTHRLSVVAEFSVVIVLDDERAAKGRPFHQLSAARIAQDDPSRELVSRSDQNRVAVHGVNDNAMTVDWVGDKLKRMRSNPLMLRRMRRILNPYPGEVAATHHAHEQVHCLSRPLHDDDVRRFGDDTPRTTESVGQCATQGLLALWRTVVKGGRRCAPDSLVVSGQPPTQGEKRGIWRRRRHVIKDWPAS